MPLNPAYTGSRGSLSFNTHYRKQWLGLNGAPEITSVNIHTPIKHYHSGIGLLYSNESLGNYQYKQMFINYSYHIDIDNGKLYLGFKAGLQSITANFGKIRLNEPDVVFREEVLHLMMPNFGMGFYYFTKNYYFGASIPQVLTSKINNEGKLTYNHDMDQYDYALYSGILISLESFQLKPNILYRYQQITGEQIEVNIAGYFNKGNLMLSGGFRSYDSYNITTCVSLSTQIMLGYSYDIPFGKLAPLVKGSHEIFFRYEFKYIVAAFMPNLF